MTLVERRGIAHKEVCLNCTQDLLIDLTVKQEYRIKRVEEELDVTVH